VITVNRFLEKPAHPFAPVLAILFVSGFRLLIELGLYKSNLDMIGLFRGFLITISFYLVIYFLFAAILSVSLSRPLDKVAKIASIGLLFGLLPPLLDLFAGSPAYLRYTYFRHLSWSLFSSSQPLGESLTLWLVILATGMFVAFNAKSILRGLAALSFTYAVFLICSGVFLLVSRLTSRVALWINVAWLAVAFVSYLFLRRRALLRSFSRLHHAIPHSMLAACGAGWVGVSLADAISAVIIVFFVVFLLIIQNDYYDRLDDRQAGEKTGPNFGDVVWSNFFGFVCGLWLFQAKPLLGLIMFLFFVVGLLYQHPAVRLKTRFCLSYKAEGVAGLLAFLGGAAGGGGFSSEASLLVPGLLVLGGATLVSIPKDYKDGEADRRAGIPTYYVVLTGRGKSERKVHLWISTCVTVCLLVPPMVCLALGGPVWAGMAMTALALAAWVALVMVKNRRRAVGIMLGLVGAYLLVLTLSAGALRGKLM